MNRPLVIGSRGSKLALFQAEQARRRLLDLNPAREIRIEVIKTTGDVKSDPLTVIGGKGVFTKEIEDALLDLRIDIAVHSLKDLPTVLPDPLIIGAICEREDPRDALVLRREITGPRQSLQELPAHAIVGTSSQRRIAQLKALRSDVVVRDLRGNVDTRLRKLDEGRYDALILASAGLKRLSLADRITAAISIDEMLPAVGQGAIVIETRKDDYDAANAVRNLNHPPTQSACLAERSLLRALGGGCQLPIAGYAVLNEDVLELRGLVASRDGATILRERISGPVDNAENLGIALGEKLLSRGANSLLRH